MLSRSSNDIPVLLRGSYVSVEGRVIIVSGNRCLISPVYIAGVMYDHLWILAVYDIEVGDTIRFFAKLGTYGDRVRKWCCKLPYHNFQLIF